MYKHQIGRLSRGAVLDVGLKCVHSCKFCYYSYLDGSDDQFRGMRRASFRSFEECQEILRQLKSHGCFNFDVTGGEPTLHPQIVELMRYAHQELGLHGRIITLGQMLMRKLPSVTGERLIDDLLEAGLTNFLFSMHAVDEDLFKQITGESFDRQRQAMDYLDARGFQYTSNTTVFEWNYQHLPDIAREILKHQIYLHNFIIMNAYYQWNHDGKAFGVQAKYQAIYPYLQEAVEILESAGVGVNIRYAPLCSLKGLEKNLVGMVGVRYDPYEWMNLAGHTGGDPMYCATPLTITEGDIEEYLRYQSIIGTLENGVQITGVRGQNLKQFAQPCTTCAARSICDGIDPNYLKLYGDSEFTPYSDRTNLAPLQWERRRYSPPFLVKTDQYEDMKSLVRQEFARMAAPPRGSETSSNPTISVVIPCYNAAPYLQETVESVIDQTCQDFELIIVDDGSTDHSPDIARSLIAQYPHHRISLITQANSGQPAIARNTGIQAARGTYILPLDADDLLYPTTLEDYLTLFTTDPSIKIAYSGVRVFGAESYLIQPKDYKFEDLRYANQLSYCSMYAREVWEQVGGYRTNIRGCEDWDFWVAAGVKGYSAQGIPKPLFCYRSNASGVYQDVLRNFPAKLAQIIVNNAIAYPPEHVAEAQGLLQWYATTLPQLVQAFDLRSTNYLLCPDWQQPEMVMADQLMQVFDLAMHQFAAASTTLLIDTTGIAVEEADQLLSNVVELFLMMSGLESTGELGIRLVGPLHPDQRNLLLSQVTARLTLPQENQEVVATLPDFIGTMPGAKAVPVPA